MKRHARRLLLLSAVLWAFTLVSLSAQTARAEISGNCEATFKGVDVRNVDSGKVGDAIDVDENEVVAVTFSSPAGFASHEVDLEVVGVRRTVSSKTDDGDTQWSETVNVKDYAWAGAGLYKVIGSATLSDGSSCSGAALINVTRNPLTTVAGLAAVGATAVGGAGVLGSSAAAAMGGARAGRKAEDWIMDEIEKVGKEEERREAEEDARREARAWHDTFELFFRPFLRMCPFLVLPALLLTGIAMVTPGAAPSGGDGLRLKRVPWRPRLSIAGLGGGALLGAGVVVLLQQYGEAILTSTLAIEGLVVGLVIGLVLPNIIHTLSLLRINATIARGERRLSEALGLTPGARPQGPPPSAPMPPSPPEGPQE